MRRKDREVTNMLEIIKIMEECQIVRLGLSDGHFPYIVPLNFAYMVDDNQINLYVHGAMAGRKYELLSKNPYCSFEMDVPIKIDCIYEKKDVTMRYKSIMGTARADFLSGQEKQNAIDDILMKRYKETRTFDYNKGIVERTAVIRLKVLEITAKVNL